MHNCLTVYFISTVESSTKRAKHESRIVSCSPTRRPICAHAVMLTHRIFHASFRIGSPCNNITVFRFRPDIYESGALASALAAHTHRRSAE